MTFEGIFLDGTENEETYRIEGLILSKLIKDIVKEGVEEGELCFLETDILLIILKKAHFKNREKGLEIVNFIEESLEKGLYRNSPQDFKDFFKRIEDILDNLEHDLLITGYAKVIPKGYNCDLSFRPIAFT